MNARFCLTSQRRKQVGVMVDGIKESQEPRMRLPMGNREVPAQKTARHQERQTYEVLGASMLQRQLGR